MNSNAAYLCVESEAEVDVTDPGEGAARDGVETCDSSELESKWSEN